MLAQPDPLRQRCIDLSNVLQDGHGLFQTFTESFFYDRRRDRATTAYQAFATWYNSVLAVLTDNERPGFERIRTKPVDPTWDETWEIALGHRPHPSENWLYKRNLYNTHLRPYMAEMIDYLTTLRLHLFPELPFPNSLRIVIADQFHELTNDTIDALFIENGCLIDWHILPLRPTKKQSTDRVLGWIDGLVLYTPNDLVLRLQSIYQAFLAYKGTH